MLPAKIKKKLENNTISPPLAENVLEFYNSYRQAVEESVLDTRTREALFDEFLTHVIQQKKDPHPFSIYHEKITTPYNYQAFGLNILKPLVLLEESQVFGQNYLQKMTEQINAQENVILFGNHQIEPDPQMIYLMLEKKHLDLADRMIFIAGDRVTTDPLAVPFSLGCNLLCIYSKKYVDSPPELKTEKLSHNQQTMRKAQELLKQGGQCIYVAPSGGRDRRNDQGQVIVSDFDPLSIEMFRLISKRSGTPTHFYPLALVTYHLLPPPESTQQRIGEERSASRTPIQIAFGPEIDMDALAFPKITNKTLRRQKRSEVIQRKVEQMYALLC